MTEPKPAETQPKPSEPRPATDEGDVPDRVLDELKLVFGGAPEPKPETEPVPVPETAPAPEPEPEPEPGPELGVTEPAPERTTIVIGGDDSLPDAVYLDDGALDPLTSPVDAAAGRNTIVIGNELDSSGVFDAVEVPSRSMDPRVRARRVAVKRARGRKRLLWAGVIALVVLIGVAVLAVFSSSLFAVETIDVQGAAYTRYYDGDQLQAIIDDLKGQPVLLVDTLEAERKLESIPWIERAFVRTDFPNRVFIDIRERRPLATFVGSDGKYRVIDRDGRVVSLLDGRPTDYMLLTGPAPDVEVGGLAGAPFAAAAQLVSALPAEIRSLAVSASVDATTGDLGLVIVRPLAAVTDPATSSTEPESPPDPTNPDNQIEVRVGNASELDAKLARLLQFVRDGLDKVVRIDVSTNKASVTKEK